MNDIKQQYMTPSLKSNCDKSIKTLQLASEILMSANNFFFVPSYKYLKKKKKKFGATFQLDL